MSTIRQFDTRFQRWGASCQAFSWALLRILASAMFVTHGWPKLFGPDAQPFL